MKRIALVYQAGLANVFEVECFNLASFGRDAKRLLQSDFRSCELFCLGMAAANNCTIKTFACNIAGDISDCLWSENLEDAPFNNQFNPVFRIPLA